MPDDPKATRSTLPHGISEPASSGSDKAVQTPERRWIAQSHVVVEGISLVTHASEPEKTVPTYGPGLPVARKQCNPAGLVCRGQSRDEPIARGAA